MPMSSLAEMVELARRRRFARGCPTAMLRLLYQDCENHNFGRFLGMAIMVSNVTHPGRFVKDTM